MSEKTQKRGIIIKLTKPTNISKAGVRFANDKYRVSAKFDFDPDKWYSTMAPYDTIAGLKEGSQVNVAVYESNGFSNFDVAYGNSATSTSQPTQTDPTNGDELQVLKTHVVDLIKRVTKLEEDKGDVDHLIDKF